MGTTWISIAVVLLMAHDLAALETSGLERVCYFGSESADGRIRYVVPPDPCSCTIIRLGGHNRRPPKRDIQPLYIDAEHVNIEGISEQFDCKAAPVQYTDCQQILDDGHSTDGVYTIYVAEDPMEVYCRMDNNVGFIVFQRRIDGAVSFERTWSEYEAGFGNKNGEFWLGNANIKKLTDLPNKTWRLVIDMQAFGGEQSTCSYSDFSLSGRKYALYVDGFNEEVGQPGDSLHGQQKSFTTKDQDNDESGGKNCAVVFKGGWWFNKCKSILSNLNGVYIPTSAGGDEYDGIQWGSWKGSSTSLKACRMKMY